MRAFLVLALGLVSAVASANAAVDDRSFQPQTGFAAKLFKTQQREASKIAKAAIGSRHFKLLSAHMYDDGTDGGSIFTFESSAGIFVVDDYDGVINLSQTVATGRSIRNCAVLPMFIEQLSHPTTRTKKLKIRHVVDLDADGKFKNLNRTVFNEVKHNAQIADSVFEATTDGYYNTRVLLLESLEGGRQIFFERLEKNGGCSLDHSMHYGGN